MVGIGASAGGLEACTALLKALPVNPGMAFVVVQHLDPHHESILHKVLSKTTEMPVIQVEDGMVLEPDHVYVIPPKHDTAVRETTLRLLSRRRTAGSANFEHLLFKNPIRMLANQRLRRPYCWDKVVISTLVSSDARKGQEKGNVLDVAAWRNAKASKALNS